MRVASWWHRRTRQGPGCSKTEQRMFCGRAVFWKANEPTAISRIRPKKKYISKMCKNLRSGTNVVPLSVTGCTKIRMPCLVSSTKVSLVSMVSMVPMLPLTNPLSLSRLRVNRTRIPGCSHSKPASAWGSPTMQPSCASIFLAASGNSAPRRAKFNFCAPLFVTVKKVKSLPVSCSNRRAFCTALSRSRDRVRPSKKFFKHSLDGW